jgi:hypothetical protein
MCGRIIEASGPRRYRFVEGLDIRDSRFSNIPRRDNRAPGEGLFVIRTVTKMGYQVFIVDGRRSRASRLIFLCMTGKMPDGEVRRLNGGRLDNRWANLKVGRFSWTVYESLSAAVATIATKSMFGHSCRN